MSPGPVTNGKPAREGRRTFLIPAGTEHTAWFGRWRSDLDQLHLWTAARRLPAPNEVATDFERMLAGNMTLVAVSKQHREPVGFVQAYNFSTDWGWAYLLGYFDPESRAPGIAIEATYLFVDYLFSAFPLRKLYADVFEYNDSTLRLLGKCGFREEGRFEEHVWWDDRYWPLVRLALFRQAWYEQQERLQQILNLQHDIDHAYDAATAP